MNLLRSSCIVAGCFVCLATCPLLAQADPNLSALAGCWSAKVAKEAVLTWTTELLGDKRQGECKVTAKEDWFVCLVQDSDGNLNGEMSKNRNERSNGGGLLCTSIISMSMVSPVYRCRIQKTGATELVFDRCQFGQCGESERLTMNVSITQVGAGWSIKLPDGKLVTFEKYKNPDK